MLKNKKEHVMKLIISIILCSFVSSCYLSYEIREKKDFNEIGLNLQFCDNGIVK